ncbi:MAG: ABC transporter ATP-binding protein [Thermoguttaceae bacterium]
MPVVPAIDVDAVSHRYGQRQAVVDLTLQVEPGEIFALLGPNGSGKTTLFRLLSTLIPVQQGNVRVLGNDIRQQTLEVRASIGVVFQAASLDKKLTVAENVRLQGRLYGLTGAALRRRQEEMLSRLGLTERAGDLVETLSGGLRRRVELAKGMLHRPRLLLLDEPSTGLDPGARADVWQYLQQVREESQVTVVLTTHLLDEADRADRIAIMCEGSLVALDTPAALRATVGGDSITIRTENPDRLAAAIRERFACDVLVLAGGVRLEQSEGHQWISRLVEAFPDEIETITLGKPTLEDVFIDRTGHQFWENEGDADD